MRRTTPALVALVTLASGTTLAEDSPSREDTVAWLRGKQKAWVHETYMYAGGTTGMDERQSRVTIKNDCTIEIFNTDRQPWGEKDLIYETSEINLKLLVPVEHVVTYEWWYTVRGSSTRTEGYAINISYPPEACTSKGANVNTKGCTRIGQLRLPSHRGNKEQEESAYRRDRLLKAMRHLVSLCSGKTDKEPF
jgi:hypothetical protein